MSSDRPRAVRYTENDKRSNIFSQEVRCRTAKTGILQKTKTCNNSQAPDFWPSRVLWSAKYVRENREVYCPGRATSATHRVKRVGGMGEPKSEVHACFTSKQPQGCGASATAVRKSEFEERGIQKSSSAPIEKWSGGNRRAQPSLFGGGMACALTSKNNQSPTSKCSADQRKPARRARLRQPKEPLKGSARRGPSPASVAR